MATLKYKNPATSAWETLDALPAIGQTVEITATELAGKSTADRATMYAAGTLLLKVVNGDTEVLLGLGADGSTEWLGSNKPVRNLLDNSDFTNPVNQRGQTSYVSGQKEYGIDRWFLWSTDGTGTQTINDGSITVAPHTASNIVMSQRFEKGYLDSSKHYTRAVRYVDGTIGIGVAVIQNQQSTNYDVVDVIVESSEKTILRAALYEGSYTADTLPPYTPKGYATELAECQRYFNVLPSASLFLAQSNALLFCNFLFPQMRIIPTITLIADSIQLYGTTSGFAANVAIQEATVFREGATIGFSTSGASTGVIYRGEPSVERFVGLSADL